MNEVIFGYMCVYLSACSSAFYQPATVYHYCMEGLPFAFRKRARSCGFVFIMTQH